MKLVWLKRRRKLEPQEEEKVNTAYNALNEKNQTLVTKKANKEIAVYTGIAVFLMLTSIVLIVVALTSNEGLYELVVGVVLLLMSAYMFFCDFTWIKAKPAQKMLLVFDYARQLAVAQDKEEMSAEKTE